MSDAAKVTSVEAVEQFSAALRIFQNEAESALMALDQQVAKVLAWYEYDVPHYWKEQVRRSFDEVSRTRTALDTCRMRTVAGHRPACYEEKEAFAAAKRRLELTQEKVEHVRRWAVRLRQVIDEFRAQSGRFKLYLETDVEKTAALLSRTVTTLEAYLGRSLQSEETPALPPPTDPKPPE